MRCLFCAFSLFLIFSSFVLKLIGKDFKPLFLSPPTRKSRCRHVLMRFVSSDNGCQRLIKQWQEKRQKQRVRFSFFSFWLNSVRAHTLDSSFAVTPSYKFLSVCCLHCVRGWQERKVLSKVRQRELFTVHEERGFACLPVT